MSTTQSTALESRVFFGFGPGHRNALGSDDHVRGGKGVGWCYRWGDGIAGVFRSKADAVREYQEARRRFEVVARAIDGWVFDFGRTVREDER